MHRGQNCVTHSRLTCFFKGFDNPSGRIPDDPEIPLLLNQVRPAHEVVKIDYHLPGCPPSADSIFATLVALLSAEPVELPYELIKYD